jgi:hypothetical protein
MLLPAFADWPLPVAEVRLHCGLLFVRSAEPGGFSAEDYRKIPGANRIELWDGVAVVYPKPDRRTAALARYLYELVEHIRPDGVHPYLGPMDVVVGRATVYAPDVLALPCAGGPARLAVDVAGNRRAQGWRERLDGYARAGVAAHWTVDADALTLTVRELRRRRGGRAARRRRELVVADCGPPACAPYRTPGARAQAADDPGVLRRVIDGLRRSP